LPVGIRDRDRDARSRRVIGAGAGLAMAMLAAALLVAMAVGAAAPPPQRPNILLFLTDDLDLMLGGMDSVHQPRHIPALRQRGAEVSHW
jgi:hypothetical protein